MPGIAATIEPREFVLRRDEVTPVIANTDEVASIKSTFAKCEVDEAKIPLCAEMGEEVAAVSTPKLLAQVKLLC